MISRKKLICCSESGGFNNKKSRVMTIFGTRPEAIKLAPVVKELAKYPDKIESSVIVTAQHRQMSDQIMDVFGIKADFDLQLVIRVFRNTLLLLP